MAAHKPCMVIILIGNRKDSVLGININSVGTYTESQSELTGICETGRPVLREKELCEQSK